MFPGDVVRDCLLDTLDAEPLPGKVGCGEVSIFDVASDLANLLPPMGPVTLGAGELLTMLGLIGWANFEIRLWRRYR